MINLPRPPLISINLNIYKYSVMVILATVIFPTMLFAQPWDAEAGRFFTMDGFIVDMPQNTVRTIPGKKFPTQEEFMGLPPEEWPYSSSFLSLLGSKLSGGFFAGHSYGIQQEYEDSYDFSGLPHSSGLAWESRMSPLIERFDRATKALYGALPMEETVKEDYSKPISEFFFGDTSLWQGYCHKRTAANLDKRLNSLARNQYGLVCNAKKDPVIFAQGEIKELFTAFTQYEESNYIGHNNYKETDFEIRDHTGFDDVNPYLFHKHVYDRLYSGQAVGLETDAGKAVDNQAVFFARSVYESVDMDYILKKDHLHLLPLLNFKDNTPDGAHRSFLKKLVQMQKLAKMQAAQWIPEFEAHSRWTAFIFDPDRKATLEGRVWVTNEKGKKEVDFIYKYYDDRVRQQVPVSELTMLKKLNKQVNKELKQHKEDYENFFIKNKDWLFEQATKFDHRYVPPWRFERKEGKTYDYRKYYRQRNIGYFFYLLTTENLARLIEAGEIEPKRKIKIYKTKTVVTHRKDTPFNTPEFPNRYTEEQIYDYYLFSTKSPFTKKEEIISSAWISMARERPDVLWWIRPIDIDHIVETARFNVDNSGNQTASYFSAFDYLLRMLKDCEPLENYLINNTHPELSGRF